MVELEEFQSRQKKDSKVLRNRPVYNDWRKIWKELDEKLELLRKTNHYTFSKMMMEQEVVVSIRSKAQLNEVISAVERVTQKIAHEVGNTKKSHKFEALGLEKQELGRLKRDLVLMKVQMQA